jgi:hypothetical protein
MRQANPDRGWTSSTSLRSLMSPQPPSKPPTDVQAAVTVLGRLPLSFGCGMARPCPGVPSQRIQAVASGNHGSWSWALTSPFGLPAGPVLPLDRETVQARDYGPRSTEEPRTIADSDGQPSAQVSSRAFAQVVRSPGLSLALRKSPGLGPRWVRAATVEQGHQQSPTVQRNRRSSAFQLTHRDNAGGRFGLSPDGRDRHPSGSR